VARHDTVVVPTLNCEPDFGLQLMVTGAVPPLNVGSANFTVILPLCPVSTTGVIAGHFKVSEAGGRAVADMTITVDLQEAFCCSASTALQINDAFPTGKSEPDAGEHVVVIGVPSPVTLGVSVTDTAFPSNDVSRGEGHQMAKGATVES
jgi:hypothetical protein